MKGMSGLVGFGDLGIWDWCWKGGEIMDRGGCWRLETECLLRNENGGRVGDRLLLTYRMYGGRRTMSVKSDAPLGLERTLVRLEVSLYASLFCVWSLALAWEKACQGL